MAEVYSRPKACDVACIQERTEFFFCHAVPHLMAAAQIYGDIPQIFEEQNGVHDWDSFTDNEVA